VTVKGGHEAYDNGFGWWWALCQDEQRMSVSAPASNVPRRSQRKNLWIKGSFETQAANFKESTKGKEATYGAGPQPAQDHQ
jgi:hypothetical protein